MRNLFKDRPRFQRALRPFRHQTELPDNLWIRCGNCQELLYVREYENNLKVCQKCEHHARLSAQERIEQLLDRDSFQEEDGGLTAADPLGFQSLGQTYPSRVSDAQVRTGLNDALLCGRGQLETAPLRLGVCDFNFMGASMGSVVGEKLVRAIERCLSDRLPLVTIVSSGGARMHEGIFSLMQMAKTAAALARLAEARLPYFSVLTDPTTGGVTASWAGLGDVLIAEPGALIGFAGPRVIEQITKQKLPPDAQRSEFLLQHGMLDLVVPRRELRPTLARLLRLYGRRPANDGRRTEAAIGAAAAGQSRTESAER